MVPRIHQAAFKPGNGTVGSLGVGDIIYGVLKVLNGVETHRHEQTGHGC